MKTNSEKTANAAKSVELMRLELEKCQRELKECQERIKQMEALSAHENSERQQTEEKLNRLNVELAQQAGEAMTATGGEAKARVPARSE